MIGCSHDVTILETVATGASIVARSAAPVPAQHSYQCINGENPAQQKHLAEGHFTAGIVPNAAVSLVMYLPPSQKGRTHNATLEKPIQWPAFVVFVSLY